MKTGVNLQDVGYFPLFIVLIKEHYDSETLL